MLVFRCLDTLCITKVKGHADEVMVLDGRVTALLMKLLTLVVGGLVMLSLMCVVTCLGYVVGGILSFLIFIVSSLPSPGLLSTMTGVLLCGWAHAKTGPTKNVTSHAKPISATLSNNKWTGPCPGHTVPPTRDHHYV